VQVQYDGTEVRAGSEKANRNVVEAERPATANRQYKAFSAQLAWLVADIHIGCDSTKEGMAPSETAVCVCVPALPSQREVVDQSPSSSSCEKEPTGNCRTVRLSAAASSTSQFRGPRFLRTTILFPFKSRNRTRESSFVSVRVALKPGSLSPF
jgi:hypothetical protein